LSLSSTKTTKPEQMQKEEAIGLGVGVSTIVGIAVIAMLLGLASCGTGHVTCDAYGDNGVTINEDIPKS